MRMHGFDVHLASSPGAGLNAIEESDGPIVHVIETERDISPFRDLRSLFAYALLIRRIRPDVVNGSTPKAALLSLLAAKLLGVRRRVYVLRGLRGETLAGPKRRITDLMERVTSWSATDVVSVSHSLRTEYVQLGLNAGRRVCVLGAGSSNGVAAQAFLPATQGSRQTARNQWGVEEDTTVFVFVGRLHADKGVTVLLNAMQFTSQTAGKIHLILQGEVEDESLIPMLEGKENLTHLNRGDVRQTFAGSDVLVLPTLREGFPNVVLEAACMGIPTISTYATGARDAVVNGETGILVKPGDAEELRWAMETLAAEPQTRHQMGSAARMRALADFQQEPLWELLQHLYLHGSD